MRLIMENRDSVVPYMVATVAIIQVITITLVLAIPTKPIELVCTGLFTTPNAIKCYEQ